MAERYNMWRYELHPSTITRPVPDITSPQVSIDFQYSLELVNWHNDLPGNHLVSPLNSAKSRIHNKDTIFHFSNLSSANETIEQMFRLAPTWFVPSRNWLLSMSNEIAASILAHIHSIGAHFSFSFVLAITKEVHVIMGSAELSEALRLRLAVQQSLEAAARGSTVVRPTPILLFESLATVCFDTECTTHEQNCAICLEELHCGGRLDVKRLPCSHCFHGMCIFRWFQIKDFCPLCRSKMPHK